MDEVEFEQALRNLLESDEDVVEESFGEPVRRVSTFEEAALLTGNRGLVVRIGGGEFQLQIVRSR